MNVPISRPISCHSLPISFSSLPPLGLASLDTITQGRVSDGLLASLDTITQGGVSDGLLASLDTITQGGVSDGLLASLDTITIVAVFWVRRYY